MSRPRIIMRAIREVLKALTFQGPPGTRNQSGLFAPKEHGVRLCQTGKAGWVELAVAYRP